MAKILIAEDDEKIAQLRKIILRATDMRQRSYMPVTK